LRKLKTLEIIPDCSFWNI